LFIIIFFTFPPSFGLSSPFEILKSRLKYKVALQASERKVLYTAALVYYFLLLLLLAKRHEAPLVPCK
jgi:hypothetical protein